MIQATKITKEIHGKKVLDNIDLEVNPGEILVIMGPSGSGKSTLVRNLSLIDTPDTGRISIDNINYDFDHGSKPLSNIYAQNIYPKVTVVFQQFFLWPHLTVGENVHLGLKRVSNEAKSLLSKMYKLFDIEQILSKYPNEISVGQKQKVSLVRAIILQPKYLFLDEITSALDIESTLATLSILNDLKKRGVAIVFVTHALNIAQKIADKVVFLENGKIVEKGTRDILFTPSSERLKRFINTPIYT